MDKILTASPSGIITLDFDGKVALVNPSASRLLGLAERAMIGQSLDELGDRICPRPARFGRRPVAGAAGARAASALSQGAVFWTRDFRAALS